MPILIRSHLIEYPIYSLSRSSTFPFTFFPVWLHWIWSPRHVSCSSSILDLCSKSEKEGMRGPAASILVGKCGNVSRAENMLYVQHGTSVKKRWESPLAGKAKSKSLVHEMTRLLTKGIEEREEYWWMMAVRGNMQQKCRQEKTTR